MMMIEVNESIEQSPPVNLFYTKRVFALLSMVYNNFYGSVFKQQNNRLLFHMLALSMKPVSLKSKH